MRRILLFFLVFANTVTLGFSQSANYANGNGTILETKIDGNAQWVFRKHIQRLQIGNLAMGIDHGKNKSLIIYRQPILNQNNILGEIKLNDYINITQVAEVNAGNSYHVWLKIETGTNIIGWIYMGEFSDPFHWLVPYFNNRWEILETIRMRNRVWTVRKMGLRPDRVSAWLTIDIRDRPGFVNTEIISRIIPKTNDHGGSELIFLTVIAMTEETETVMIRERPEEDHWLKINFNGVEGWIFGGYTGVERGGAKYFTPENLVYSMLGWH